MMKKMLILAAAALIPVLMFGARSTAGVKMVETEREQINSVVMALLAEVPEAQRGEWLKIAAENPELLLRLNTAQFIIP